MNGRISVFDALYRSAELHSVVSQNSILHRIQNSNNLYFKKAFADWNSAIQQVGNLRYVICKN